MLEMQFVLDDVRMKMEKIYLKVLCESKTNKKLLKNLTYVDFIVKQYFTLHIP
jgi:hypothetical protein